MINNRQDDLMKVFDKTWKANHSDVAKKGREQRKKFMDRMFANNRNISNVKSLTPGEQAQMLQNNMNNAFNGQKIVKINNIIKKWK